MVTTRIDKTRMKDKFSLLDCNAFFLALEAHGAPWYDEQLTGQASNLAWLYFNRSRQKLVTSMVKESNSSMSAYAEIILQMYGDKWNHIWDLYQLDYNPIENYNMIESGSDINTKTGSLDRSGAITRTGSLDRSGAITRTGSLDRSGAMERTGSLDRSGSITRSGQEKVSDDVEYKGKETFTPSGTIIDSGNDTDNQTTTDNGLYGYNSSNSVNADHGTQKQSHKNTRSYGDNYKEEKSFTGRKDERDITTDYMNVQDEDTRKDTYNHIKDEDTRKDTYNNIADTDSRKDTYNNIADTDSRKETYNNIKDTGSHSLTRSGNIGTTTTQMMAESEIEYRKHLYFEMVFSDIDHILTLPVY